MAKAPMSQNTKSKIGIFLTLGLCCVVGIFCGTYIANHYMEWSTGSIFLFAFVALIVGALGSGIAGLATITEINAPNILCYLPFTQDVVIYNVMKGLSTKSSLQGFLQKFNFLLTTNILFSVSLALFFIPVEQIAIVAPYIVLVTGVIAYIVRIMYFDYIFRVLYSSVILRVLGVIPPIHLGLIAFIPNQINRLKFFS